MNKFIESLIKLVPEDERDGLAESVKEVLEQAREEIRIEEQAAFDEKLAESQAAFEEQLSESEKVGYEGYQEATQTIMDLRDRLAKANEERVAEVQEVCEEAHGILEAEKAKVANLESQLREEFEADYQARYESLVDQVDAYMQYKVTQIVENVRLEVVNDPRTVEHKVVLDKVIENLSPYVNDETRSVSNTRKALDEATREISDLRAKVRVMEDRNIRLNSDNRKLSESVRKQEALIAESVANSGKAERKEKKALVEEKAKNSEGRGHIVNENRVINEPQLQSNSGNGPILEGLDQDMINMAKSLI